MMAGKINKQHPAVRGLAWHRHQYYSFFAPIDWHRFHWSDDREGEIHGPDANDPLTVIAVDVRDLGMMTSAEDLDIVAEGFFQGIEQLPGCQIELRDQKVSAKQPLLEAKYTYLDQGETRKCWVRVFYHGTRQIAISAQGATIEKFDYWLPWFYQAMMTAKVHSQRPKLPPG
jgi:hypothetical protein